MHLPACQAAASTLQGLQAARARPTFRALPNEVTGAVRVRSMLFRIHPMLGELTTLIRIRADDSHIQECQGAPRWHAAGGSKTAIQRRVSQPVPDNVLRSSSARGPTAPKWTESESRAAALCDCRTSIKARDRHAELVPAHIDQAKTTLVRPPEEKHEGTTWSGWLAHGVSIT